MGAVGASTAPKYASQMIVLPSLDIKAILTDRGDHRMCGMKHIGCIENVNCDPHPVSIQIRTTR